MNLGIKAAIFLEGAGQNVKTRGLVGADGEHAAGRGALIGDGADGFVAQGEKASAVFEENFAGGSEADFFAGTVEEARSIFLLEQADLGADGGLREKDLFSGAREVAELGDFEEGGDLIEIHRESIA